MVGLARYNNNTQGLQIPRRIWDRKARRKEDNHHCWIVPQWPLYVQSSCRHEDYFELLACEVSILLLV